MVCVDSCNFYEIPNVFTPNGDDFNDWLLAKTSALVEKVEFRLFNRAGVLVFTTQEPRLNWDGTYKGIKMPSTDYWYTINVDLNETNISGHFTLLR